MYSQDQCTMSLNEYFHSMKTSAGVATTALVNESQSDNRDEYFRSSTNVLDRAAPASTEYLRGYVDKVLPRVNDGEVDEAFDLWDLLELFFGTADHDSSLEEKTQKTQVVVNGGDEIDSLSDDIDNEELGSDSINASSVSNEDEDHTVFMSLYSEFLRFADYMFGGSSTDDDDDDDERDTTIFEDDEANQSSHLRLSKAL